MALAARGWYLVLQKLFVLLSLALGLAVIAAGTYTSMKIIKGSTNNGTATTNVTESSVRLKEDNMSAYVRKVVVVCSVIAIIAGSLQCLVSLCNLFSCARNSGTNTKIWLAIHALIFIALLVCILLPFSFNNESGKDHQINEFVQSARTNLEHAFKLRDFKKYIEDVMSIYYIVLVINEAVIFSLMIMSCCCMRCGLYEYDNLEESLDGKSYY